MTHDNDIVTQALQILRSQLQERDVMLNDVQSVIDFVTLNLATQEREVFAVLLLDTRHRLIEYKELFYGTIDKATVFPREVLRAALLANAAAVILAHNHPSGVAEPSQADINMTRKLAALLAEIDVRVLDHVIVGGGYGISLAGRGLL